MNIALRAAQLISYKLINDDDIDYNANYYYDRTSHESL